MRTSLCECMTWDQIKDIWWRQAQIFTMTVANTSSAAMEETNNSAVIPISEPPFPPQYLWTLMNGISFVAICVNVLHIIFMTSLAPGRRTGALNFKRYILLLAYVDLTGSLFRLSVDNRTVQQAMFDYKPLCIFTATFIHGLNVFESTQLALMSLERFIAVQWPRQYPSMFFTRHFFKLLIATIIGWWLVYIIVAILFHNKGYSVKGSGGCQLGSPMVPKLGLLSSGAVIVMLIFIILFYFLLLFKATSIMRRIQHRRSVSEYRQIRQITISVNVIVLSKIVCWSPLLIAVVLRRTPVYNVAVDYVGRVFLCLYCLISPILYGSTSTRYRRYVKRKLFSKEVSPDPLATSIGGGAGVGITHTTNSHNKANSSSLTQKVQPAGNMGHEATSSLSEPDRESDRPKLAEPSD